MFPYPAFGHINPFLQLGCSACAIGSGVRITFLSASANVPQIESLLPASMAISIVLLHLSAMLGLSLGVDSTADLLKLAVDGTRPQVESLLRQLRPHLVLSIHLLGV
ncbi:hypothetical protein OPV22_006180 [Ensete ventricosum]|uniref:Uncharacterized protein n=1 Tax=Ensete ventricosum TaxID=4639 RepID=A0AAV8RS98_ENSVE|nr:hypothetical protein OPV22_006180 [Ensete ventricosum]